MKHINLKSLKPALLVVCVALCLTAGSASVAQELLWPTEHDLRYRGEDPLDWIKVGDVSIWNTKDDLKILIQPGDGSYIKEANIHVLQDPAEFESVLDNKGKPKAGWFEYKNDFGAPVEDHTEVIPLASFDICWSVDPEICEPNLYIIVHAELTGVPEAALAEGDGVFDRLDTDDGTHWGWYVSYPLAKVDPGHFVDANVNGLFYETITQSGITGYEGQFWFLPEEWIDFYAGNLWLGDAFAERRVTPMDLFDGADMEDDRVVNMARLLQSFDGDGNPAQGAINLTEPVIGCLNSVLPGHETLPPEVFFANDEAVGALIDDTIAACAGEITLTAVSKEEALENLNNGMQAANLMKRNISKTPGMASDKAKIEIMPVYVPAQRPDGTFAAVGYYNAEGEEIETRDEAKPIVVAYLDEVEGAGVADVYVAISRDDGDSWKRRNVSKTADKSSLAGHPGTSQKPMLKVKDNMIFVAWTDKYCRGGRPGYAITVCPDTTGDGIPDPCEICRETGDGTVCTTDYKGDDAYWQDDLFGAAGPQRSVTYDDYPEMGEVPYSCVWTSRAVIEPNGMIQWFKPERVTSGRRDAFQLFAGAGEGVAFGIVWQEDPRGLMPGEGDGPGEGWSGANTHNKADVWYSYITMKDFAEVDYDYPAGGHGDGDLVDDDPDLAGRVKALVPMSLPVRVSDNEVCSAENMDPDGGHGEHDFDGEGQGTHRYCGTVEGIGTDEDPGTNPLCAYTIEKANPRGEIHNVCVTADGRLLDGNTGASRPNIFLQPYKKPDGSKSAWAIIGYEESKGVGTPPEGDHDEDPCGTYDGTDDGLDDHDITADEGHDDDRYKPDMGKNVIYHSFDFANPVTVAAGGIINLPETDEFGNLVYLVDEFGETLLDWKGEPFLAYENARRVRFITQPKSKAGASKTVLVTLYRQGEEGSGKPADIFMRRVKASPTGNPYAFGNFLPGAQNVSSVEADPDYLFQDPFDPDKPVKMLRWSWTPDNLADSSAKNPYNDSRAHRGALNGDVLLIGYTWTPNWGRAAPKQYDFFVRRSFDGGMKWSTDPADTEPIEHNVVFRVPIVDYELQTVTWDEEVVTTAHTPDADEPARNVSNLRNNRVSVLEPRLVKAPGTIKDPFGNPTGYPEDIQDTGMFQLAYGLELDETELPDGVTKMPLDIYYSRTKDKGQRYESVIVTPQGGTGRPQEGWNPLARELSEEGAVQLRQTPNGSRMYAVWLEQGDGGSDIMFRRVDYRTSGDPE